MSDTSIHDERIREVIAIARQASQKGNSIFGALLVGADGATLAVGENSQATDNQVLAHAEMNLLHNAVQQYDADVLDGATLYTSAEPCAMCTGALFWSGVGRLVFGLSSSRLHEIQNYSPRMLVGSASDVLEGAGRRVEVIGPVLEDEAAALFSD
jgi:tRNA(adenine34) deaminase